MHSTLIGDIESQKTIRATSEKILSQFRDNIKNNSKLFTRARNNQHV